MTSFRLLAAAGALAAVALAGCSGSDHPTTPGPGSSSGSSAAGGAATPAGGAGTPAVGAHDDADVTFASMMVPHHRQAVEMSDMLLAKQGVDARVVALATEIKTAQTAETTQMSGWLAGWGQDPSTSTMGEMPGTDYGDGMMSQADMDALDQASGNDAGDLFLTGMIKHHQGAVAMAETELAQGQNADAKGLAQSVVTTQKAEITTMRQLLHH